MTVFERGHAAGTWHPSPLAAGSFAGLQGGAVAGLLTAEVEEFATRYGAVAVSATAWFLKPVPMRPLRSELKPLRLGGRVAVVDNALWVDNEEDPCACVRVTLAKERPLDLVLPTKKQTFPSPPEELPLLTPRAPHGKTWFMDAMEVRATEAISWFRLKTPIVEGAAALASVLGPADWAHGIARPLRNAAADPNPNVTVHLFRRPVGDWIGVRSRAWWEPLRGLGAGEGILLDRQGEVGCVSMTVILMPIDPEVRHARDDSR